MNPDTSIKTDMDTKNEYSGGQLILLSDPGIYNATLENISYWKVKNPHSWQDRFQTTLQFITNLGKHS